MASRDKIDRSGNLITLGKTEASLEQRAKINRFPFPFPTGALGGKWETERPDQVPTVHKGGVHSRWSAILSAPIRVGCASPLRVATDGDANWSSKVRRRRSPAHTNRRRDFVIGTMNAGQYVELFKGENSFPSNSLKGISLFSLSISMSKLRPLDKELADHYWVASQKIPVRIPPEQGSDRDGCFRNPRRLDARVALPQSPILPNTRKQISQNT